mmetsp:Transcript_46418/g.79084  ORF Transcript_46418/g.79084 Transcript_46418/m.79084 type:complete len:209 (-) Transcript_46418:240-866(-)
MVVDGWCFVGWCDGGEDGSDGNKDPPPLCLLVCRSAWSWSSWCLSPCASFLQDCSDLALETRDVSNRRTSFLLTRSFSCVSLKSLPAAPGGGRPLIPCPSLDSLLLDNAWLSAGLPPRSGLVARPKLPLTASALPPTESPAFSISKCASASSSFRLSTSASSCGTAPLSRTTSSLNPLNSASPPPPPNTPPPSTWTLGRLRMLRARIA